MSKECRINGHEIRSQKDLADFIEKYQTPWNRPLGRIGKAILYEQMKVCFVHKETVGGKQHGIVTSGDESGGSDGKPSKKLQEHWAKEEEKRKRFERNPLTVT